MKKILYTAIVFLVALVIISFLNLDLKVASLFHIAGTPPWQGWPYHGYPLWMFSYKYGYIFPDTIGVVALLILIFGFFVEKLKPWRNRCIFAVLLLLLAPGLIVQTLKVTWGRPRPIELKEFGATLDYRSPFNPNIKLIPHGNDGNSFPSGHAAIGFYTLVLYFIFKKRNSLLLLGLAYGGLMGIGRMAQGAHFLSDVLTSLFIIYITAEGLYIWLLKSKQ